MRSNTRFFRLGAGGAGSGRASPPRGANGVANRSIFLASDAQTPTDARDCRRRTRGGSNLVLRCTLLQHARATSLLAVSNSRQGPAHEDVPVAQKIVDL